MRRVAHAPAIQRLMPLVCEGSAASATVVVLAGFHPRYWRTKRLRMVSLRVSTDTLTGVAAVRPETAPNLGEEFHCSGFGGSLHRIGAVI
jgi:hypothetical protein